MATELRAPATAPLVRVSGLVKHFQSGSFGSRRLVQAVNGVDLELWPGEVLAVVGESGSGKSTLARCILGLESPTEGTIELGESTTNGNPGSRRSSMMQPIFQDPYGSLDPRWTVRQTVAEGFRAAGLSPATHKTRIVELLEHVGLGEPFADKRPHELSGGQRQRVCIAAALAASPEILIADEPVTALDVSVQAQVLNLLHRIQRESNLAVLLIAHDLSVVSHISSRVAVMYLGRIVESGPTEAVFTHPRHPYTQGLMKATPRPDPSHRVAKAAVLGEIPSPAAPPTGCHFHPRCPHAIAECPMIYPSSRDIEPRHQVACHVAPRMTDEGG